MIHEGQETGLTTGSATKSRHLAGSPLPEGMVRLWHQAVTKLRPALENRNRR